MIEFSELAEELDNLQEKYQVSFVISAGNYDTPPLLDYPATGEQLKAGRITTPADSVLGITVGAVSHVDYKTKGPKEHHPSAFSRHGAGPNYVIKPDLVHYGGSCSTDASHISRAFARSTARALLRTSGRVSQRRWSSRTLAQIYHQVTPTPSPVLARALLTHHARDPRTSQRVPDGDENFFGFGLPAPVPYCLECTPHTSTLVFDDVLRPGYFLEWDDFPYPPSLQARREIFRRNLDDGGLRAGARRAVGHGVLRNAYRRAFRRLPQGEVARDRPGQAEAEIRRPGAAGAQERGRAIRVLPGGEASQVGAGAHLLRQHGETASAASAGA